MQRLTKWTFRPFFARPLIFPDLSTIWIKYAHDCQLYARPGLIYEHSFGQNPVQNLISEWWWWEWGRCKQFWNLIRTKLVWGGAWPSGRNRRLPAPCQNWPKSRNLANPSLATDSTGWAEQICETLKQLNLLRRKRHCWYFSSNVDSYWTSLDIIIRILTIIYWHDCPLLMICNYDNDDGD